MEWTGVPPNQFEKIDIIEFYKRNANTYFDGWTNGSQTISLQMSRIEYLRARQNQKTN